MIKPWFCDLVWHVILLNFDQGLWCFFSSYVKTSKLDLGLFVSFVPIDVLTVYYSAYIYTYIYIYINNIQISIQKVLLT